jgi:hypothetical protein
METTGTGMDSMRILRGGGTMMMTIMTPMPGGGIPFS